MPTFQQFIGGEWRDASNDGTWDLIDPATERSLGAAAIAAERRDEWCGRRSSPR
jgi:acyl-CoA reductase-like NAD-dependent aldehyde dehydrogenase